jgi:hypothetical protein
VERSNPYRIKSEHRGQNDAGVEVNLTMTMGYIMNTMITMH